HVSSIREDRELVLRRDRQELRIGQSEAARLGILSGGGEKLHVISAVRRAEHDRLPVGSKKSSINRLLPERERGKGDTRRRGYRRPADCKRGGRRDEGRRRKSDGLPSASRASICDRGRPTDNGASRRGRDARQGERDVARALKALSGSFFE